ncbi:hypothetical protein GYB22_13155 [bacterium]|nr:hypothetical protein [bacterium]
MKKVFIALTLLFAFFSCSKTSQTASFHQSITPPFEEINLAPGVYSFDVSEDFEFITETGTQVSVPANSFVDKDGNPIMGEVQLEFTEYHGATDIMLSGIPMTIQTQEGQCEYFESAGMFTMDGKQGDAEIEIAEGKSIEVNLASFEEESDYSSFVFNEEEGNWVEIASPEAPQVNEIKKSEEEKLPEEPVRPTEIQRATSDDQVFELAVNTNTNPEFEGIQNLLWRPADRGFTFAPQGAIREPKLYCLDREKSIYKLEGKVGKEDINMDVQPVLFGSNFRKAQAVFRAKLEDYTEKFKEREKLKTRINKMAAFHRQMTVQSFGTYNFDRFMKMKNSVSLKPLFIIPAVAALKNAFLVIGKDKCLIPFRGSDNPSLEMMMNEKVPMDIITINEEGEIFEFTKRDFKNLNFPEIRRKKEYSFEMKPTGLKVTDRSKLETYIANL